MSITLELRQGTYRDGLEVLDFVTTLWDIFKECYMTKKNPKEGKVQLTGANKSGNVRITKHKKRMDSDDSKKSGGAYTHEEHDWHGNSAYKTQDRVLQPEFAGQDILENKEKEAKRTEENLEKWLDAVESYAKTAERELDDDSPLVVQGYLIKDPNPSVIDKARETFNDFLAKVGKSFGWFQPKKIEFKDGQRIPPNNSKLNVEKYRGDLEEYWVKVKGVGAIAKEGIKERQEARRKELNRKSVIGTPLAMGLDEETVKFWEKVDSDIAEEEEERKKYTKENFAALQKWRKDNGW